MIIADIGKVEFSYPATPIMRKAYLDNPTLLEKSVIITDLEHIFTALVAKYDVATCADLITQALEDMIKELDKEGEVNED